MSVDQSGLAVTGQLATQLGQLAVGGTATSGTATGGTTADARQQWRSPEELESARRRAFLDSKDSMSGLRAVRNLLSEEVTNRGGAATGGTVTGSIPSIAGLEAQLHKLGPAPGIQYDAKGNWITSNDEAGEKATFRAMAFPGASTGGASTSGASTGGASTPRQTTAERAAAIGFDAATPNLAPSGGLPQAGINSYIQSDVFKNKLRASDIPLNEVAQWQLTAQPITAPRQDPGRDAKLAAFAATGDVPDSSPGEAVLAAGAGNAYGTRGGQFVPGATMNLGFLDTEKLPPLNSQGYYSSANPGNYRRLF